MQKKLACLLGPVGLVVLAIVGCESESGSSSSGSIAPFDGGGVDALPPLADAPAGDAPVDAPADVVVPQSVTVFVTKPDGSAHANVDVVFHDATGAVLTTVKTGADGKATSTGPVPAMATALLTANQADTEALTWTALQPGDELRVTSPSNDLPGALGSYSVAFAGPQAGAAFYFGYAGSCFAQRNDADAPLVIEMFRSCARPGNTNAVVVYAYNNGGLIGSAFAKNLGLPNNNVVNTTIGAFAAPTNVTLTRVNAPAQGEFYASVLEVFGSNAHSPGGNTFLGSEPVTAQITTGFADALQTLVVSPSAYSQTYIAKRWPANTTAFAIDLAQAPPRISAASIDKTTAKRPKVSWTTSAALTGFDGGVIRVGWSAQDEGIHGWTILVAPNATNAQVPALPAAAAKWEAPTNGNEIFGDPGVAFVDADILANEAGFRREAARALPFRVQAGIAQRIVLPAANSTFRLTEWAPNND